MDFIERLRGKSPETKKRIAFVTSAVITLAIFGVWVSVLRFGTSSQTGGMTAAVANSSENDVNPLSAFWSVISEGWDGLANNINQIKTGVESATSFVNELGEMASTSDMSKSVSTSEMSPPEDVFILD